MAWRVWLAVLAAVVLAGCGPSNDCPAPRVVVEGVCAWPCDVVGLCGRGDAGIDAAAETGVDAGPDAAMDAQRDASLDAPRDVAPDVAWDAPVGDVSGPLGAGTFSGPLGAPGAFDPATDTRTVYARRRADVVEVVDVFISNTAWSRCADIPTRARCESAPDHRGLVVVVPARTGTFPVSGTGMDASSSLVARHYCDAAAELTSNLTDGSVIVTALTSEHIVLSYEASAPARGETTRGTLDAPICP